MTETGVLMFNDLLGDEDEIEEEAPPAKHGRDFSLKLIDVHELERGVTVAWLCQAFTITKSEAVAKLTGCPAIKTHRHGGKLYDLRVAAGYLVKPKLDMLTYIRNLDSKDLPDKLKKEFWGAKLAEQRWRRQAGELWANEDVIALYSELFKLIKSKSQLWEDRVASADPLTDVQREILLECKDDLIAEIYNMVKELEAGRMTASSVAEADDDETED